MIITTADKLDSKKIDKYLSVVIATEVVGINIFRDIFAKVRDIFGGSSASYKNVINDAITTVINEISRDAKEEGGNAIIGLRIQQEPVPSKGSAMLMVSAYGTACIIRDIDSGK